MVIGRLGQIDCPVHLIIGMADKAVPPHVSVDAARKLANAKLTELPNLGHLAHEEDPATIARLIQES